MSVEGRCVLRAAQCISVGGLVWRGLEYGGPHLQSTPTCLVINSPCNLRSIDTHKERFFAVVRHSSIVHQTWD